MRNKKKVQELRRSIAFVVDGDTEQWYLQLFKEHNHLPFRFIPELPDDKSIQEQYSYVISHAKDYEKLFWIMDLDVVIRESREYDGPKRNRPLNLLKKYLKEIKKLNNVFFIANTPGFEYWVLLHFKNTKKYYETCDQVITELHKIEEMKGYEKSQKYFKNPGNDIYKRLNPYLKDALTNSKRTGEIDFDNIESGISQMHKLFDELLRF